MRRGVPAAAALEKYLTWVPDDNEAKRGLAAAYRGQGQIEKAVALEKDLVKAGGAAGAAGGAPGAQFDEACARAGLDSIAANLKTPSGK